MIWFSDLDLRTDAAVVRSVKGGHLPAGQNGIRLPIVERLEIQHMSLYRNVSQIDVNFGEGVLCLAGANGLGKSTFLAIINYAITGIVADPNQKFASLREYYRYSLQFSKRYFEGRVDELDRDLAVISITIAVGEKRFEVTRGMFEPNELRTLKIADINGSPEFHGNAEGGSEGQILHQRYVASMIAATGLATFEQLVFLQHFLMTFDERRHLLFWDPDVARQALYLVFGVDGDQASQADEWLRRSDRLESQARNAQYQATTARQKIKELSARLSSVNPDETASLERYQFLVEDCDRTAEALQERTRAVDDARHANTLAAARVHSMTADYEKLFASQLTPSTHPREHPLIQALLAKHECALCGSNGDHIAEYAETSLSAAQCPLCQTGLSDRAHHTDEAFEKLEELDRQIANARAVLRSTNEALDRLVTDVDAARSSHERAVAARNEFERQNVDVTLSERRDRLGAVDQLVAQLEAERIAAIERRDDFRKKRDDFRRKLAPVQRELASKYVEAKESFIPRFQRLAYEFLGLDLQITMEQRARGPELTLTINGTARRMTSQLSESQRYFVDIALRMALAEHICGGESPACLLVDTPEGSLDLAYESRAGRMFGQFVKTDNRLIMTANINSSRLIQELAKTCGHELMRVERMTEWTTLSEVQAEAEELFDQTFEEIEQSLSLGDRN